MDDQDKSSELLPSVLRNASDVLGAHRFMKFEQKMLIDASQLAIGPMISEGNYSVVYEGVYKSTPVAVKVIQPDMLSSLVSPELQEKFSREVIMLSEANHANIVELIGVTVEPTMTIVTELMKGGTLQKFLRDLRPNCPDLKISVCFALEISQAMEYLHQNRIIHRDLKPSNLLLTEDKKKIKLADFGLARELADGKMTSEVGTYRWMAPELFSVETLHWGAKKHYDHKVDVYSFSMILWELLTNHTPFKDRNNVMVAYAAAMNRRPSMDNIPLQIAPFLQSCWAEKPQDRPEFQQITEFLKNFLCSLTKAPSTAMPSLSDSSSKEETDESHPATDYWVDMSRRMKPHPATDYSVDTSRGMKSRRKRQCLRFLHRFLPCLFKHPHSN